MSGNGHGVLVGAHYLDGDHAVSFEELMVGISRKFEKLQSGFQHFSTRLGPYQPVVDAAIAGIKNKRILDRIWSHDHTVWKPNPKEISNNVSRNSIFDAENAKRDRRNTGIIYKKKG